MDYQQTKSYPLSGVPEPLWEAFTDAQPSEQTVDDHLIHTIPSRVDNEFDRDELDAEAEKWLDAILDADKFDEHNSEEEEDHDTKQTT